MNELTENQVRIVQRLIIDGALTSRRVVQEYGPKPSWMRVLEEEYLREVHTVYGPVLGLSHDTYDYFRERPELPQPPYLKAPSSLADRAYQMDAIKALQAEGYEVVKLHYKRGSTVSPGAYTSQVTSVILRVPPHMAEDGKPVQPYNDEGIARYQDQRGYPRLYASISGGGIKLAQLKKLLKENERSMSTWGHPLLIAVPENHELDPYLRAIEAKGQRIRDELEAHQRHLQGYVSVRGPRIPRVRLIEMPMPKLTSGRS